MKRENGFYWVKHRGNWIVALWTNYVGMESDWRTTDDYILDDSELDEINETKLIPPQ